MSDTRVRLSLLDQSPIIEGHSVADAIAATVDLAQAADDLGYHRYWCAEHHGSHGLANPAPEIMVARLAAATRHLRIGSGGVMLPYYSPWKVAEQFLTLEALFPGRIDLGLGRAPGGDQKTAWAVAGGPPASENFPQQVQELAWLLSGQVPAGHPYAELLLQPRVATRPELWMLGSSDFGGRLAAQLGIRFCFAHFINADYGDQVARIYREQFHAGYEEKPYSAVALFVVCADTEQEAAELEAAVDLRRLNQAYGRNVPIPNLASAKAAQYSPRDLQIIASERPRNIIGTPEKVVARMLELKERFVADEIVVLTVAASYHARLRTTQLLAEAFSA
jgi:luciferase family oxidoreductase group 1